MIADRYVQQCLAEANQPTIRLGATGAPVIRWQRLLTEATGQACPRLGTFDVVTATATRAYQRQLGVGADGVVGARTWQAAMMRHCKRGTRAPVSVTATRGGNAQAAPVATTSPSQPALPAGAFIDRAPDGNPVLHLTSGAVTGTEFLVPTAVRGSAGGPLVVDWMAQSTKTIYIRGETIAPSSPLYYAAKYVLNKQMSGLGDVMLFSAIDWKSAMLGAALGAASVLLLKK